MNNIIHIQDLSVDVAIMVADAISLGLIALAACALFLFISSSRVSPRYRQAVVILAVVNVIAAYNYWRLFDSYTAAMESGSYFNETYRYLDWILAVPLLLTALVKALGISKKSRVRLITRLVPAAIVMIALGYVGEISAEDQAKIIFCGLSSLPFFYILYVLYIQLTRALDRQAPEVVHLIGQLRVLVTVTWMFYPISYLMPIMDLEGKSAFVIRQFGYTIADIIAKCAFALMIYRIARLNSAADDPEFAVREGILD